jgi:hypothetical protein
MRFRSDGPVRMPGKIVELAVDAFEQIHEANPRDETSFRPELGQPHLRGDGMQILAHGGIALEFTRRADEGDVGRISYVASIPTL